MARKLRVVVIMDGLTLEELVPANKPLVITNGLPAEDLATLEVPAGAVVINVPRQAIMVQVLPPVPGVYISDGELEALQKLENKGVYPYSSLAGRPWMEEQLKKLSKKGLALFYADAFSITDIGRELLARRKK